MWKDQQGLSRQSCKEQCKEGKGCKVCLPNNHQDYVIGEGAGAKLQVVFVLAQMKP